jgi:hypothetical protein
MVNILTNDEYLYDYNTYEDNGLTIHQLISSNNTVWTPEHRCKLVLSITEHGDSMVYDFNNNKTKDNELSYSQAEELLILLRIINQIKIESSVKTLL